MLSPKIQDAFNKHLNHEFFSSYLYLSMAAYFETKSLKGMSHWMRIQVVEENLHVMKFFDFIHERGGRVLLAAIDAPEAEWSSPLNAFEQALEHERQVTGLVGQLMELSLREKDHSAGTFLHWFVTEQVEEEASVQEIVDKLKLAGDNPVALLMIDQELAGRTAAPPAASGQ